MSIEIAADLIDPVVFNYAHPINPGNALDVDIWVKDAVGDALSLAGSRWVLAVRKKFATTNLIDRDTDDSPADFTIDEGVNRAKLRLTAEDTESFEPGVYEMHVQAEISGKRYRVAIGTFRVEAAIAEFD